MVVALGALDADTEEQLSCCFRGVLWVATGAPEVGRRIFEDATVRGQQFCRKLIEWLVVPHRLVNPLSEFMDTSSLQFLAV